MLSKKFKGYIVCPNLEAVCRNRIEGCNSPESNLDCAHKGRCSEGNCICQLGFAGDTCSQEARWEVSPYEPTFLMKKPKKSFPTTRRDVASLQSNNTLNFTSVNEKISGIVSEVGNPGSDTQNDPIIRSPLDPNPSVNSRPAAASNNSEGQPRVFLQRDEKQIIKHRIFKG